MEVRKINTLLNVQLKPISKIAMDCMMLEDPNHFKMEALYQICVQSFKLILLPPAGETGQDSGGSLGGGSHAKHSDIVGSVLFETGTSPVHLFIQ